MFTNKNSIETERVRRLDSTSSNYGGWRLSSNMNHSSTMLIKLTTVCLLLLDAGQVQAMIQNSKSLQSSSLDSMASNSDILPHKHHKHPTLQYYKHDLHETAFNRLKNSYSGQEIDRGGLTRNVDSKKHIHRHLKLDSNIVDGSKCVILVSSDTNKPTLENCSHTSFCNGLQGIDTVSHALDWALNCTATQTMNVELRLTAARLTLYEAHRFKGHHAGITISGNPTHIKCQRSEKSKPGISFNDSTNIAFESVTLSECGAEHESTSVDFITMSSNITTTSAIYLLYCMDVALTDVAINGSDGAGLTMVNCGGTVNITGSTFTNNSIKTSNTVPGGGGLSIELLSNCSLGPKHDINTTNFSTQAKYRIQDCRFINNSASSGKFLITHITQNKIYFRHGQGGGLFVNFDSNTSNNSLSVESSYFEGNKAQRGGGLFVGYRSDSSQNNILVTKCAFLSNACYRAALPPGENHSSGGAICAIFFTNTHRSNFFITGTNFTQNLAYYGGAISLGSGTNYYSQGDKDLCNFTIERSQFDQNNARIGAALDLYYRVAAEQSNRRNSVLITIYDTTFTMNGGVYHYRTARATGRTFATIYIVHLPVQFYGRINIVENNASGLGIEEATVLFKENSYVTFENNTAKIGGGMALIGRSTVVLHANTRVIFQRNYATEKGGAIFSTQSQERYAAYDYTCFIQYKDDSQSSMSQEPSKWNASLIFAYNQANSTMYKKNAIHASSILPCVWPSNYTSNLSYDIRNTFCGWTDSWHFLDTNKSNCTKLISTAPSKFNQTSYSVEVIPGKPTRIPNFGVLDDLNHEVSSALYTVSKIMKHNCTKKTKNEEDVDGIGISVTDEGLMLMAKKSYVKHNCRVTIFLQTADRKSITTQIDITILTCPPGYKVHDRKCRCQKENSFNGLLSCNSLHFTSTIFAGYCMTYDKVDNYEDQQFIVARCPYVVGTLTSLHNEISANIQRNGYEFCKNTGRTGKLCSECLLGLGLDVYSASFKCTKCKNVHQNWIKVIAASTVPTTLLFILCTIFHISITSAPINGYIFFSHVITMRLDVLTVQYVWHYFKHNNYGSLSRLLHVPYQLWTFDFPQIILHEVCLGKSFRVIHALALQYLSVLYPLLLVIAAIVLIDLHAKNCKPLVWLWRPLCYLCVRFRHSWHIRTTVIDTFASFLLLSYSNLIGVSMSLLTPSKVMISNGTIVGRTLNYDTSVEFLKRPHLQFAIFAIIILCTFGAIPPVLLILYPFKWFQYLINRCRLRSWRFLHVFVDAFQGSYKNGIKGLPERRYFAGVYFLFRIAINVIYLAVEEMIKLHLILTLTYTFFLLIFMAQRPYKKNIYNIVDGVFLSILVTTHAMTVYLFYYALAFSDIPKNVWYFTYSIQHIPTLYMILVVIYLVSFRMRCVKRFCLTHFGGRSLFFKNESLHDKYDAKSPAINTDWPSSSSLIIPSPSSPHQEARSISDIPDRVENPHRYEPLIDSWQFSASHRGNLQDFSESGGVSNRRKISDYASSLY